MIRCSSIHAIMTKPKGNNEWSETAKTAMMCQVREELFNVRKDIDDVKMIQKGVMLEGEGVELYNRVFLYNLEKQPPESRRNNGIITGEPDLLAAVGSGKGVDIKVAWSLLTFPLTADMAAKKEYEWQARGYMCLFDVDVWEIAYCALDTPEDLLKAWDNPDHHIIDPSIPEHHRITIKKYERDLDKEHEMLEKCKKANQWVKDAVKQFSLDHDKYIK